jgi:hypothetical protein
MTDERNTAEYWTGKTDPTELTTDALRREISALEKLIDTRIGYAEKLAKEKFRAIQAQLDEADKQRLEQKGDGKEALVAALDSQERAISKSERHTADQIDQVRETVDTKVDNLEKSQAALDRRVTIVESLRVGQQEQRVEQRAVTGTQVAVVGLVVTIVIVIINVVLYALANSPSM